MMVVNMFTVALIRFLTGWILPLNTQLLKFVKVKWPVSAKITIQNSTYKVHAILSFLVLQYCSRDSAILKAQNSYQR